MREAEELCGRIALIARGRIVAEGRAGELKRRIKHDEAILVRAQLAAPLRARLEALPGVLGVAQGAGACRLLVRDHGVMAPVLGLGHAVFRFTVLDWGATLAGFLACAGCGLVLSVISLGVAFLKRGDAFAFIFAFPDAIAVLSGVFYPVSVFPAPLRLLAETLPTTHAFNMLKAILGLAEWAPARLAVTLELWGLLSLLFTRWALRTARRAGRLVKMK